MITAVDTNVLLDIFLNDPTFASASARAMRQCLDEGSLIVCDVVWAEIMSVFPEDRLFNHAKDTQHITFSTLTAAAAARSGRLSSSDREKNIPRHKRVIADFLVAAHAQECADRLLTRDRGFYRSYFKGLKLFDPANESGSPS